MNIKFILAAIGIMYLSGSASSYAMDVNASVYAGVEEYQWEEYDPNTGSQLIKITGPRVLVGLNLAPKLQSNLFALDYDVSMYEGTLNYASQTVDAGTGASIPFSSDVAYMGFNSHFDGIFTGFGNQLEPVLTLGFEGWRRSLDSRTINESTGAVTAIGYAENWAMIYTKLGLRGEVDKFSWDAGLKLPLSVTNTTDYLQATTHPKGLLGGYIGADYAFANTWKLGLDYEATRFGQSDPANSILGANSVVQPKSDEDVIMLSLNKAF